MPIRSLLDDHRFDPETTRIMAVAFETAHIALRLSDRDKITEARIPERIMELNWTTPTLVEICVGLEINGYLPAEF
jgi:coenzyme PQQ precursor peptide PqqA